MFHIRLRAFVMTGVLVFATTAPALGQAPVEPVIPHVLFSSLKESRELYVAKLLLPIRKYGEDRKQIDQKAVDRSVAELRAKLRTQVITQMLLKDADGDGRISSNEMAATFKRTSNRRLSKNALKTLSDAQQKKVMRPDANGDGYISMDEVLAFANQEISQLSSVMFPYVGRLLALDPNGDGVLTLGELEGLANETFDKFDRNVNGWIDVEETVEINDARGVARRARDQRERKIMFEKAQERSRERQPKK